MYKTDSSIKEKTLGVEGRKNKYFVKGSYNNSIAQTFIEGINALVSNMHHSKTCILLTQTKCKSFLYGSYSVKL